MIHAAEKSPRAKYVKLGDKTSNLRALAASPPADWPPERIDQYVAWARQVAAGLLPVEAWLDAEFEAAARAIESRTAPPA